jgi:hypothetical protein
VYGSPPARVPSASHTTGLIELLMMRALPVPNNPYVVVLAIDLLS